MYKSYDFSEGLSCANTDYVNTKDSNLSSSKEKKAVLVTILYVLLIGLLLVIRAGNLLIPLFPLTSVAVGLYLYYQAPVKYITFTWWITFLTPVIRRMIDYQSGYLTPGPWTLSATLVASISIITLVKKLPSCNKIGGLPFVICALSTFYGLLIAWLHLPGSMTVFVRFLVWLSPIAFGFNLLCQWRNYPQIRHATQQTFLWGTLVMGLYGIYQFIVAPAWDRFWLMNITANSFGRPEPFGIRVSSTSSAPQAGAALLLPGLLLLLGRSGPSMVAASASGYLSFLLTSARAGWLGFCVGLVSLVLYLKPRLQIQLVMSVIGLSVLVVFLAQIDIFSEIIASRFESFQNLDNDVSLYERQVGYSALLTQAFGEVFGRGLGVGGFVGETNLGENDGSIIPLLFGLGLLGSIPYLVGLLLALLNVIRQPHIHSDFFKSACLSIVIGTLAQFWFNLIFSGEPAMVLWTFIALPMAARLYEQRLKNHSH